MSGVIFSNFIEINADEFIKSSSVYHLGGDEIEVNAILGEYFVLDMASTAMFPYELDARGSWAFLFCFFRTHWTENSKRRSVKRGVKCE